MNRLLLCISFFLMFVSINSSYTLRCPNGVTIYDCCSLYCCTSGFDTVCCDPCNTLYWWAWTLMAVGAIIIICVIVCLVRCCRRRTHAIITQQYMPPQQQPYNQQQQPPAQDGSYNRIAWRNDHLWTNNSILSIHKKKHKKLIVKYAKLEELSKFKSC